MFAVPDAPAEPADKQQAPPKQPPPGRGAKPGPEPKREPGKPPAPPPRKPRPAKARVSLESLGAMAWTGGAWITGTSAQFQPVSRIMQMQAPVAGMIVEDTVRNTPLDVPLQFIARLMEAGNDAGRLLGPPVLTAAICRYPQLYPMLRPILAYAMREWIIVSGPKLRELHDRELAYQKEMGNFSDEYGVAGLEQMLDEIFAPLAAPHNGQGPMPQTPAPGQSSSAGTPENQPGAG